MCTAILDSWKVIYRGELQAQYMVFSSIKLGQAKGGLFVLVSISAHVSQRVV